MTPLWSGKRIFNILIPAAINELPHVDITLPLLDEDGWLINKRPPR